MARKPNTEGYWPQPSSPTSPPVINFYFSRVVGDTIQDGVSCTGFATLWQFGVFLRRVLENVEIVSKVVGPWGTCIEYLVPKRLDPDGFPTRTMRFRGRWGLKTLEELMELSERFKDRDLPYNDDNWVRQCRGESLRSYTAYMAGVERFAMPVETPTDPAPVVAPAPRDKTPSRPRQPRGDGTITLASLCDGSGVEPKHVRVVLRSKSIEKPASGWDFEPGDARIAIVEEIIQSLKGKK